MVTFTCACFLFAREMSGLGHDKVELNVDMLDPLTFRVVERLIREALRGASAAASKAVAATSASTHSSSTSSTKSKSGGNGGPKKRKGADGESRPKKQRSA